MNQGQDPQNEFTFTYALQKGSIWLTDEPKTGSSKGKNKFAVVVVARNSSS